MTILGKILVFVNLAISVLVGALVVMVYTTRVNYAAEYEKLKAQNAVLAASRDTYVGEITKVQTDKQAEVDAARAETRKLQTDITGLKTQITTHVGEIEQQKRLVVQRDAQIKAAQNEAERRQAEVNEIKLALQNETQQRLQMVTLSNKLKEEKIAADIERDTVKGQLGRMESAMRDLVAENDKLKAGSSSTTVAAKAGKNPPPEPVEGLIKATANSGLVTLTIGSDAGLKKGHTLEVFRLSSIPSQSRYLGTIKIVEISNTEAVGQPIRPLADKPTAGDRVAGKILGS